MNTTLSTQKKIIEEKRAQWTKFIETGEIDPGVKPYIAESWKRCIKYGIDHKTGGKGVKIEEKKFQDILRKNRELLETSKPIIEMIDKIFTDLRLLISVCDSDSNILYTVDTLFGTSQDGEDGTLWTGYKWSEDIVGTNGASLCMMLDKPIRTHSAEHFCEDHHTASCADAPIHGADGTVIGALLTTFEVKDYSEFALGVVAAGADAIEKQMRYKKLDTTMKAAFDHSESGVVSLDANLKVIYHNNAAEKILNQPREKFHRQHIDSLLLEGVDWNAVDSNVMYASLKFKKGSGAGHIECNGNIYPELFDGKLSGAVIMFEKEKSFNAHINRIVGNEARYGFADIITESSSMRKVIERGKRIAAAEGSVLIMGESGTGKELFAHSVHNASSRGAGPFIAINCAALPQSLIESELFGYEKGTFTGARKEGYAGKFEIADGGSIFLDEIGELPLDIQAKLLRVLDNKRIVRIGGHKEKEVDVRIIAATNRDLMREVQKGNFRLDLFYRLSVLPVMIPPLSERSSDIVPLAKFFINRLNKANPEFEKQPSEGFLKSLRERRYKGNIRELQNVVTRAYYLCSNGTITEELAFENFMNPDLYIQDKEESAESPVKQRNLKDSEESLIKETLRETGENISQTAEILGISRPTLYRKLKKYNIIVRK